MGPNRTLEDVTESEEIRYKQSFNAELEEISRESTVYLHVAIS